MNRDNINLAERLITQAKKSGGEDMVYINILRRKGMIL